MLCSGSKPYEIAEYKKALESIAELRINTIFNFSQDVGRTTLKKLVESEYDKTYFKTIASDCGVSTRTMVILLEAGFVKKDSR